MKDLTDYTVPFKLYDKAWRLANETGRPFFVATINSEVGVYAKPPEGGIIEAVAFKGGICPDERDRFERSLNSEAR